jgi:hypothetical protein
LALILFYFVMFRHPYVGGNNDGTWVLASNKTETDAYGRAVVFTDHPADSTNRVKDGFAFADLPIRLRNLFIQAFTLANRDPGKRVRANQWADAFWEFLDCLTLCLHSDCGQHFHPEGQSPKCVFCGHTHDQKFAYLSINGNLTLISHGKRLFPHHTHRSKFDFSKATAVVLFQDSRLTIRNLSSDSWSVIFTADSNRRPVNVPQGLAFFCDFSTIKQIQFSPQVTGILHEHLPTA